MENSSTLMIGPIRRLSGVYLLEKCTARFKADLASTIAGGTLLDNQARLTYRNFSGELLSDDPDTSTRRDPTVVSVVASGPAIALSKSVIPRSPLSGERVNYTLTIRNVGDEPVLEASITDQLPPQLNDLRTNSGIAEANSIEFSSVTNPRLALIDPGETVSLSFSAEVNELPPGQIVSNQARATATGLDATLSDDPSTPVQGDPTSFTVGTPPQLNLVKVAQDLNGGDVEPGDIIRYTLTLSHRGGAPATSVNFLSDP